MILAVIVVLEVLFVAYFLFVKKGKFGNSNLISGHKITVVSNDPNITLNFDPNNQDFNNLVNNELGLFDEGGVIDVNTPGMQTKGTIKDLEIILEDREQPTIWIKGPSGDAYVSYQIEYIQGEKMIMRVNVNYGINKPYLNNEDLNKITENGINNTIIYVLTRFSSRYGIPGNLNQVSQTSDDYFNSDREKVVTIKSFSI